MVRLTIVTVVFQDWDGLRRTLASAAGLREGGAEQWIIDGSRDGSVEAHAAEIAASGALLLTEADQGIYDAMNKGLDRATGDYVVFMNAGDVFSEDFDLERFRAFATDLYPKVLIGYAVETWGRDRYLHPGLGSERRAFEMPQHQATFYPRGFYSGNRYVTNRPIGADAAFTRLAGTTTGVAFIPVIVCEFALGGRSSIYDRATVRMRLAEYRRLKPRLKIVAKAVLWRVLSRRYFYRILAAGKFTRFEGSPPPVRTRAIPSLEP